MTKPSSIIPYHSLNSELSRDVGAREEARRKSKREKVMLRPPHGESKSEDVGLLSGWITRGASSGKGDIIMREMQELSQMVNLDVGLLV